MSKFIKISNDWTDEEMHQLLGELNNKGMEAIVVRDEEVEVFDEELEKVDVDIEELQNRFSFVPDNIEQEND